MAIAQNLPFTKTIHEPEMTGIRIVTSAPEASLFRKFLSRGSAFTTNPDISKVVRQFGYFSVFLADWGIIEKSFIFLSLSYKMPQEAMTASPMFKLHIVGNCIFLPNEFWGEERAWLEQVRQSFAIGDMVLGWLNDWNINAKIDRFFPIKGIRDVGTEAFRLQMYRLPEALPKNPNAEEHRRYQTVRELRSYELADWHALIERSINDLSCLKEKSP